VCRSARASLAPGAHTPLRKSVNAFPDNRDRRRGYTEMSVSDRGTFEDLSQSASIQIGKWP